MLLIRDHRIADNAASNHSRHETGNTTSEPQPSLHHGRRRWRSAHRHGRDYRRMRQCWQRSAFHDYHAYDHDHHDIAAGHHDAAATPDREEHQPYGRKSILAPSDSAAGPN